MKSVRNDHIEMHIFNKAKHGNIESGDTFFVHTEKEYCVFAIADGLGSGPVARQAADVIPAVLRKRHHKPLGDVLDECNRMMLGKRGATVAIVKINYKEKTVGYGSVGNIRFYILRDRDKLIYPLPIRGFLSGKPLKIKTEKYDYEPGDLFFLHSDGVILRSPDLLLTKSSGAGELYKNALESVEQHDDATFIAGSLL